MLGEQCNWVWSIVTVLAYDNDNFISKVKPGKNSYLNYVKQDNSVVNNVLS